MKRYSVLVPIAGHIYVEVEAANADEAVAKALESEDLTLQNIHQWEAMGKFHSGNVCHCPSPWEADAEEIN